MIFWTTTPLDTIRGSIINIAESSDVPVIGDYWTVIEAEEDRGDMTLVLRHISHPDLPNPGEPIPDEWSRL